MSICPTISDAGKQRKQILETIFRGGGGDKQTNIQAPQSTLCPV